MSNSLGKLVTPRGSSSNLHEVLRENARRRVENDALDVAVGSKVAIFEGIQKPTKSKAPPAAAPSPAPLVAAFDAVKADLACDEETGKLADVAGARRELDAQLAQLNRNLDGELAALRRTLGAMSEAKAQLDALLRTHGDLQGRYDALAAEQQTRIGALKREIDAFASTQRALEADLARTKAQHDDVERQLAATRLQMATLSQAAPVGAVALVFTDVQGSTTQWEMHADVMAVALSQHNDLMRRKIDQFGGYEVKTEGDAFMIAFGSCLDAVRWCLDVQLALLDVDWPDALYKHPDAVVVASPERKGAFLWRGLRVRMGVHFGEPKAEKDPITTRMDYFGPMVNRSARVEGATHGGQIIVSSTVVAALGENMLPSLDEPQMRLLGDFQLKGLDTPETLYELLPRELARRTFPPPPVPPVPVPPPAAGVITFVVADVAESSELFELYPAQMVGALRLFKETINAARQSCRGYLMRSNMDTHLLVFAAPADALAFALTLQSALLEKDWPKELAEHDAAATVRVSSGDEKKRVLFRGLRARVSVHRGDATCRLDADAGVTLYQSAALGVIGFLHDSTNGGQVLITDAALGAVTDGAGLPHYTSKPVGQLGDFKVSQVLPTTLAARTFANTAIVQPGDSDVPKPPQSNHVAIVAARIAHSTALWEEFPAEMRKAVRVWEKTVRGTALGYIASSKGSRFLVAFESPIVAAQWCLKLQSALLEAQWPDALAASKSAQRVGGIFAGLRAAMAIEYGAVDGEAFKGRSSIAGPLETYGGKVALDAEQAAKAACGGQTLVSERAWQHISGHVEYDGCLAVTRAAAPDPRLADAYATDVGRVMLRENQPSSTHRYVQLLPKRLQSRVSAFPRRAVVPPIGDVAIVFAGAPALRGLMDTAPVQASEANDAVRKIVRTALLRFDGYEARSDDSSYMLAFDSPLPALQWCHEVQTALRAHKWSSALRAVPRIGIDGGVRMAMSVHCGKPRYESHPLTNHIDFFGDVPDAAALLESVSHAGQVLVTNSAWTALNPDATPQAADWTVRAVPHTFRFPGIERDNSVWLVLPSAMASETFPPLANSKRPRITGETLRLRVDRLDERRNELTTKLHSLEGELTESSTKVKALSAELRSVERSGTQDPAAILARAFSEVEQVLERQDSLFGVVKESTSESADLQRQLTDVERQLQLLGDAQEMERSSMNATIQDLKKELERRAGGGDADRAKLRREFEKLRTASAEAAAAVAKAHDGELSALGAGVEKLVRAIAVDVAEPLQRWSALQERLESTAAAVNTESGGKATALLAKLKADVKAAAERAEAELAAADKAKRRAARSGDDGMSAKTRELLRQLRAAEALVAAAKEPRSKAEVDALNSIALVLSNARIMIATLRDRQPAEKPKTRPRSDSADWVEALQRLETAGGSVVHAADLARSRRRREHSVPSALDAHSPRKEGESDGAAPDSPPGSSNRKHNNALNKSGGSRVRRGANDDVREAAAETTSTAAAAAATTTTAAATTTTTSKSTK